MPPVTYLTRIVSICAGHRLHNPELSDEENKLQFGRCNHVSGHGHNYRIEVTVMGEIIPKYGYAMNLFDLKRILVDVVDPLDHKRIDTDIEYFTQKGMIATAENIAIYIWENMEKLLPSNVRLYNIRIGETDTNVIDYKG